MSDAPIATARMTRDERREQLLAVARRLFAERGFQAVSMTDVAAEAGVARGLVNHHFASKRELEIAVVRDLLRVPPPLPEGDDWPTAVERWLDLVERNREAWFGVLAAGGLGADPELQAVLDEAREAAVARCLRLLGQPDTPERRAVVRSYSGFAEAATAEWLRTGRIDREPLRRLLTEGLPRLLDIDTL